MAEERDGRTNKAVVFGSKAASAAVGGAIGGPGGALLAVALEPVLTELVGESWRELAALRQQAVGVMVQDASERLDVPPEDLFARAWSSEEGTQLIADAMYEAAQTFNMQKIRALGRAVANGLRDDAARPDQERLVVAALASVEEAHIKVLLALPQRRRRPSRESTTGIRTRLTSRRGASLGQLAETAGLTSESAEHVLAELVRTGTAYLDDYASLSRHEKLIIELQEEVNKLQNILANPGKKPPSSKRPKEIKRPGSSPEGGYALTRFGDVCLHYLQDMETEPEPEDVADVQGDLDDDDLGDSQQR